MLKKHKDENQKPYNVLRKRVITAALGGVMLLSGAFLLTGCMKDGKDGTKWYSGVEISSVEGKVGDFFYDTDDCQVYIKLDAGWTLLSSIKGDTGEKGATWFTGTAITGDEENINVEIDGARIGDLYLNTDTSDIYTCTAENTWKWVSNNKGNTGAAGATWLSGEETPKYTMGKDGDFYLDKSTFSIYEKKNGGWEFVTSLEATTGVVKQNWDEDDTLKILNIGNSFSDDSMEYVYEIATDENVGVENVEIGKLYIASSQLSQHLANAQGDTAAYTYKHTTDGTWTEQASYKISTAIQSTDWDYITFLQLSTESDDAATYDDLQALIEIVQPLAPRAKLVWNMTWTLRSDYVASLSHSADQATMYANIVNAVQTKVETNENIDVIMPVGTAIQNAKTSYLEESRISRDARHLTNSYGSNCGLGSYIAGLTVVESLTGISTQDVSFVPHDVVANGDGTTSKVNRIDDNEIAIAKESVANAMKTPYATTESYFSKADQREGYKQINPRFLGYGYYNTTDQPAVFNGETVYRHYVGSTPKTSDGALVYKFLLTDKFTKDELPAGSIITIDSGFMFRPCAWKEAAQSARINPISATETMVEDDWWTDYDERAFNISYTSYGQNDLRENNKAFTAARAFKIFVPITPVQN